MTAKISAELLQECKRAEAVEPQRVIPVIITITDWAKRVDLENIGVHITAAWENISAISGALTAAEVKTIAQMAEVEKIEFDGEVRIA